MPKFLKTNQVGFTLVEVAVGGLLIVVIGSAVMGLNYAISKNQTLVWQNYLNVEQANTILLNLVKELRTARQGDNGAYPLESANDQALTFYADVDFDNQTEKIRYFLNDKTLYKGIIEPSGYPVTYPPEQEKIISLTPNIRNNSSPIFYYYNGNWPADKVNNPLKVPARLSETKLIRIYLRLNTEDNQPQKDFILESYTQIRMLKENL